MLEPEPASARPKPSKMDFLPKSSTSAGMFSYFVLTINSATYFVRPGAFGKSAAGPGDAYTRPRLNANADIAREFLNKSRRFIRVRLQKYSAFRATETRRDSDFCSPSKASDFFFQIWAAMPGFWSQS